MQNKANYINDLFSRIAQRYDLLNDVMTAKLHHQWKKLTIKLASNNLPEQANILDLCTGTGDIAILWLANTLTQSVTGLDSCEAMLELARNKTKNQNKISFMMGDALQLPFADNSFDAITIGFGLRNVENLKTAIMEIKRVLKPNGYIASLDLGHPSSPLISSVYRNIFLKFIPGVGSIFARDKKAYQYLVDSLETWPNQAKLSKLFWKAGFQRSYYQDLMLGTIAIVVAQK